MATKRTPWWCLLWCVETCWRFANVWRTYFVHAKWVIKIKLITVHRTTSYPLFRKQGVPNSNNSPDKKTQFVDVALSVRKKMSKQYFVSGGFLTHHTELIIQNLSSYHLVRVICVTDVVMQVTTTTITTTATITTTIIIIINKIYFTGKIPLHVTQTVNTERLQSCVP